MRLADVVPVLEAIAPPRLAEGWDNVGLLVGDPAAEVAAMLMCIDYTPAVAEEARAKGCGLVLAYHPPIFEALRRVVAKGPIFEAIRDGIALWSPHTALDVVEGGTNDFLADVLGLGARAPLRAPGAKAGPAPQGEKLGIGRIGDLAEPIERAALVAQIKRGLGVSSLLVAGPEEGVARRVAAGAGACGNLIDDALAQGAELYLTGELRHHDALKAARLGMTVVCALHSNSERAILPQVQARILAALPALHVHVSVEDRDPFTVR
jgi:dinuclear metal center YbgI/SA1388 family protein